MTPENLYTLFLLVVFAVLVAGGILCGILSRREKPATDPNERLKYMLNGKCLLCRQQGAQHRISMIASCPSDAKTQRDQFIRDITDNAWEQVSRYTSVAPVKDNLRLHVMECPDGKMAYYLVLDADDSGQPVNEEAEIDCPPSAGELLCWHELDEDSSNRFKAAYPDQALSWLEFRTTGEFSGIFVPLMELINGGSEEGGEASKPQAQDSKIDLVTDFDLRVQFIRFVRKQFPGVYVSPSTSLFHDLWIDGDEAEELLNDFVQEFQVDMSELSFNKHFHGEYPFGQLIWWHRTIFERHKRTTWKMVPVTVADLYQAAKFKKWPNLDDRQRV